MTSFARKPHESSTDFDESDNATRRNTKPLARIPRWTGSDLPRIAPGRYTASAVRIIGPEYVARWRRYSLGICFIPLSEADVEVVLFRNLGPENVVKRGSDYFKDWTKANGGPPVKNQEMNPNVFLEGQIYEIEVMDARIDSDGSSKSDAEVYSKVRQIVEVRRTDRNAGSVVSIKRK